MNSSQSDLSRLRIDRTSASTPRSNRRPLYWILGLIAIALVGISLGARGRGTVAVTTAMAEFSGGSGGGAGAALTANGYVVARTKASISSKVPGRLEYLGVSEGSVVQAGEVIARLENADYRAAERQAEAQLAVAKAALSELEATRDQIARDVRRNEELYQDKLISDQEWERLRSRQTEAEARVASGRAQIQAAGAALEVARANLENTLIRAPFSGTVLRKDAEVGELVAPTQGGGGLTRGAVATVADLTTLEVEVDVNEAYIARIRHTQPCRIILDAYPEVSFKGQVRQVLPTADRQRATVQVKVAIGEQDARILPEMGARVEFLEEAKPDTPDAPSRIMVPAAAVRQEGGNPVIWVVRSGRLERREVDAGPVSGERREIRRGLTGGEQVVIDGPEVLKPGQNVKEGR
ncbi:MAG: efflux RND transporter periplasmic adaptor subunit [Candidatus Eisenbacteria bacterium]|nr:efflux RND transporter periplasmic adaptor subunit [Candidatus Eisenbacteria bacterium]MCC7143460.1 efflux RND transporter periplasmic adaptor subunit [Candidatus Eisenbacteria bacterium]